MKSQRQLGHESVPDTFFVREVKQTAVGRAATAEIERFSAIAKAISTEASNSSAPHQLRRRNEKLISGTH